MAEFPVHDLLDNTKKMSVRDTDVKDGLSLVKAELEAVRTLLGGKINSQATESMVKEPFSGSSNFTKTFSSPMNGFVISNDGTSNLTFTIDDYTLTVRAGEVFEGNFSPFLQVSIVGSVPFRAYGKMLMGYSVDLPIDPPVDVTPPVITASPDGGVYTGTKNVILSANETATIYYTTNGSTPTENSSVYSTPIVIDETTVLKYFGKDASGNSSVVETKTYTISVSSGGTYVDDASLLLFQNNPANNQTIAEPDKYFQTNKPFTIFVTFQPIADSNSAVTFFQRKTPNAVEHEFTWNSNILFTLTGKKDQGTGTTHYSQVRKDGVTDHSISYHIAVVRDSTKMSLYVNNSKAHEADCDSNFFVDHSTAPLKFAELNKSQIKNMGYYDRALNEAELTQNYEALK